MVEDNTKTPVGTTKKGFVSNFDNKFAKTTDIIIAFTDNKILALVSAMSLSLIWFLRATL